LKERWVNDSRVKAYAKRFGQVFDYIDRHLDEELSVERLSEVANFSRFHFHRQFSDYTGITVARYVQLMRLRRASYRLVFNPEARITDIALEAAFENPESFSRAFKNTFGQTPSRFREAPEWQQWNEHYQAVRRKEGLVMKEVRVVEFKETVVAVLEHWGSPLKANDSVRTFCQWRKDNGLTGGNTYGIIYNDPSTTEPEQFHFDIGGTLPAPIPENRLGITNKTIPGGRCAVVRHQGSRDNLGEAAYYLYREWLPASGEELRDFPLFLHYLNFVPDVPEHELTTDVYLPLK
jgi:AraC family transcriptional regulator